MKATLARYWLVAPLYAAIFVAGCATVIGLNEDYVDEPNGAGASGAAGSPTSAAKGGEASTPGAFDGAVEGGGTTAMIEGSRTDAADSSRADATASTVDEASAEAATADGGTGDTGTADVGGATSVNVLAAATTLAAGASSQVVSIAPVDPSRAFLVFSSQLDSTMPSGSEVTGQITGESELTFARSGSAGSPAIAIRYFVAQFKSGVKVLRGSTTLAANSTEVSLPSPVDLSKSVPLITYRDPGSLYDVNDIVRAKLTSTSKLTLSFRQPSGKGVVEWQVVSFDGATVQSGDVEIGSSASSVVTPLSHAVDPAKTWLLESYEVLSATGTAAELLVRGRVSGPSELTFDRAGPGASATLTYYAVSFDDGITVQSGTTNFVEAATSGVANLTPVDPSKSIAAAAGLYQRGGSSAYKATANPGYGTFLFDLGTGANLSLSRAAAGAGSAASVNWFVVTFF